MVGDRLSWLGLGPRKWRTLAHDAPVSRPTSVVHQTHTMLFRKSMLTRITDVLKKVNPVEVRSPALAYKNLLLQPGCCSGGGNGAAIQELNVKTVFDILKRDSKGTFLWLEAVHDLEAARARLRQLSAQSQDEFVVFRNADLRVIASSRNEKRKRQKTEAISSQRNCIRILPET